MTDQQTHDAHHKKSNLVMWVFFGFIAYFLITEHWAHVVPYLPWLILLACPFMHLFMHGGHGHGSGHDSHDEHGAQQNHSHHEEK
jgi:hypothetical protein